MTGVNLGTLFAKLLLEDDFTGTFQKYLAQQDKAQQQTQAIANGLKVAGAAMAGFATASVGAAVELNKSMANIATLIPDNTARVLELKGAVQSMSVELGKSTEDLSQGLYELISTLGDSADNAKILEINAKAAAAGLATTQDAINFTTAVTKTYGDTSAAAFQKVSDLGFQAVNLGKTTFPELAQSIGRVAPLAKETGVSMEEMFAIVATATGVTGDTNEVMTQMAAAITALVSPTKELQDVYDKMGVKGGEALIAQKGLTGALQAVAGAAREADKPLINLLGRKEAWIIASSLAGSQAESFSQKMKAMGNVVGATDTAFRQQTQGVAAASHDWNVWKATATVAAQKAGQAILDNLPPALQAAAAGFSEMGGKALASAGEIAQVAIALKMIGGGGAVASLTASLGALTGTAGAGAGAMVLMAGKIGLVVGAAAGLSYGIDKIAEAMGPLGGAILKGFLSPASLMNSAVEGLIGLFNRWKSVLSDAGTVLVDVLSKGFTSAHNAAQPALKVISAINTVVGVLGSMLMKEVKEGLQSFFDFVQRTVPGLQMMAGAIASVTGKGDSWTKQLHDWAESIRKTNDQTVQQTKNVEKLGTATGAAAAAAVPPVKTLVDRLSDLNREVNALTAAQREQIVAGQKMGLSAKEIGEEMGKLPGVGRASEAAIQAFMSATKTASKVTQDLTADLKQLRNEMLGLGAVADANNLGKIFGGDMSLLDPSKIEGALSTIHSALETVSRVGMEAANVTGEQVLKWREMEKQLQKAKGEIEDANDAMKNLAANGIKKVDDRMSHFTGTVEDLQKQLKIAKDRLSDRQFTQGLSEGFRELATKTRDYIYQLEELDNEIANETNPVLQAMQRELLNIKAQEFGQEIGEMTLKTEEFKSVLVALLPSFPVFSGMILDIGESSDQSAKGTRRLRNEVESLKDAFTGDIGERFFKGLFSSIGDQITSGAGMSEIFSNVGKQISQQIAKGVASSATTAFGSFAGAAIGTGAGMIIGAVAQGWIDHLTRGETAQKLKLAADQMRTQLFEQVAGGNQQLFVDMLERAGLAQRQITAVMEGSTPDILAQAWESAARALQKYTTELKGLDKMAAGATLIGQSLGMSLQKSMDEQTKPFKAMQEAAIEAMKKAGASSDDIQKQMAEFAEQNKNRVFTATEDQIAQYNRLGTIVGGTIANMVGRTGDFIGAILANKDAIEQLILAQEKFGLAGDATSAATQQVIEMYKTITDNEDVFLSVQGVTQSLIGMSDAMLTSTGLANAFGQELSASFNTLIERGVSAEVAMASMAPALQRLWELQKEGKVVLDETTMAMLKQAEEQGVVGENMRNVNEQILDVLTQIRDMFSDEIPRAVPRTTAAVQNGSNAQQRAAAATQRAWTEAADQTATTWRGTTEGMVRSNDSAMDRMKRKWDTIPRQIPVEIDWKIPPLELPQPDPIEVPVEFEMPEGTKPWEEDYKGRPPGTPGSGATYGAAMSAAPGATMEGGRGTQTIVVERDGQRDLQFTAENLPDYVRIRAGNTVLGV